MGRSYISSQNALSHIQSVKGLFQGICLIYLSGGDICIYIFYDLMMSESHKIDREGIVKLHSWTISGKSLSMLINECVRMILMYIECGCM